MRSVEPGRLLAAGPLGLLVVDGEEVEGDQRRAGVAQSAAPLGGWAHLRVVVSVAVVIAAEGQVGR